MTVRRNWVIVAVVLAGGLYYWFSDEEPEAPVPQQTQLQQTTPQPPAYRPFPTPSPGYSSQQPLPPADAYPGFDRLSPSAVAPRFRPLEKSPAPDQELEPLLTYPGTGFGGGSGVVPAYPGYDSYYPPRAPAAPEYKFRPQDFESKARRWTGNYPRYPGSDQIAPMRPGGPQFQPPPAVPQQQSVPSVDQRPLWADTHTPGR